MQAVRDYRAQKRARRDHIPDTKRRRHNLGKRSDVGDNTPAICACERQHRRFVIMKFVIVILFEDCEAMRAREVE